MAIYYVVNLHLPKVVATAADYGEARKISRRERDRTGCTFVVARGVVWDQGNGLCRHARRLRRAMGKDPVPRRVKH
jgi:hypothetical protein